MSESKVYFILSPALQLVKIGKSSNLKKRLETLQSHSADDLQLLLSLPNRPPFEESQLHARFDHLRSHGEWFKYEGTLVDFVNSKLQNPYPTESDDVAVAPVSAYLSDKFIRRDSPASYNSYVQFCERLSIKPATYDEWSQFDLKSPLPDERSSKTRSNRNDSAFGYFMVTHIPTWAWNAAFKTLEEAA